MLSRNPWSKLRDYYQRRAASIVFKRPFLINRQRPLISFTFDDFPRSALLIGGKILNQYGLAGTYYASLGLAGKETACGRIFCANDLPELFEQGHELGCHTFSHCDSWETDAQTFEGSIIKNRIVLHEMFPGLDFESFSYPISLPRPFTKARIARHFLSCRGGGQVPNIGEVDLNQLSACFLEKYRGDIWPVKDLIDWNREACGWLVFATHDVSDTPSPHGCTPQFFERVVEYAVHSEANILPVIQAMEALRAPGWDRPRRGHRQTSPRTARHATHTKPLVSILIPAFNAQSWIDDTLQSAVAQTWERKEIIVVDDGSTDQTVAVARKFESRGVRIVEQKNQGAAAARNTALSVCRGDYVQWLDADDILAPDKIARQMAAVEANLDSRALLSSGFGKFLCHWQRTKFVPSGLWEDLSPTEWLLRKIGENLFMQTATWLVSRELSETSGLWDTRMLSDDDGEYFCRVLLNSVGTRFVPEAKVYYRAVQPGSLAYLGKSKRKIEALWLSMQLHIHYLRSLEDSSRTREACLSYLQRNLIHFYPQRPDIVRQAREIAAELGGTLSPPHLSWKYSWIRKGFGWTAAKDTALLSRKIRWSLEKTLDELMFQVQNRNGR